MNHILSLLQQRCADPKKLAVLSFSLLAVILLQLLCISYLIVQVVELKNLSHIQEFRIAQLEQDYNNYNNLLYSLNESVQDIQKKWTDINFRVLRNTWRLDPSQPQPPSQTQ
ncbi:hypothetical protein [uncultured Megasphaera sp.]|uniref:hypothetical protein n=1 Tax=uncultured Megasphaera sp. TaxID=165188 RepID=UPI0025985CE0|nr:hypothetical protein [uncultured Megasphaera sp.]